MARFTATVVVPTPPLAPITLIILPISLESLNVVFFHLSSQSRKRHTQGSSCLRLIPVAIRQYLPDKFFLIFFDAFIKRFILRFDIFVCCNSFVLIQIFFWNNPGVNCFLFFGSECNKSFYKIFKLSDISFPISVLKIFYHW